MNKQKQSVEDYEKSWGKELTIISNKKAAMKFSKAIKKLFNQNKP